MKNLVTLCLAVAISTLAAGVATASQTTLCKAHGQERKIELIENDQGCQVNYTKGDESKTLWSSARSTYCAPHAAEFIEKQKGWGFECAAAEPAADTATAQ
ncbi:MAG: hypothetical protein QM709_01330 [Spongiibacteraceae bacterium]